MISMEAAVDKAMEFLRTSGYPFARIIYARRYGGNWIVAADVGVLVSDKRKIRINGKNGKVIGFEQY